MDSGWWWGRSPHGYIRRSPGSQKNWLYTFWYMPSHGCSLVFPSHLRYANETKLKITRLIVEHRLFTLLTALLTAVASSGSEAVRHTKWTKEIQGNVQYSTAHDMFCWCQIYALTGDDMRLIFTHQPADPAQTLRLWIPIRTAPWNILRSWCM